ncbi:MULTISPECIES: restriction endonuclease subunit S [unclassified Acinetobacter]|uniref:restriction endonuclease subunit S n=1 Tax=unclassified Acinetobacter TaxID=196816 RepID=UPI00244A91AD|nr:MULTISPECIES: restriction endonuclease subunit S [unclassified Acinetobacter]MDH0032345.1 restriction endonuclease subunit S [Acinetobacter sp. GD04021]MDH0887815.1 restriction endonuclease subunit S [Acinetobacter sp. GD03873]MDH1084106.1 restriction endonuclease subunit S [Acinetobacter sp. GD03983]MDH2191131.1 restriction endonuclease subunit S [Acinetobacter sp. GD03645]MDH2204506.1 restriction endonuclease subunit S [Acinetobacter sp. GD03647]
MSWGVKTINELYSIKGGKRLPKGVMLQTTPNKHPYIRITDMKDGKVLNLVDSFMYVPEAVVSTISSYRVKQSDLILSIVGQIGSINIIGETLDGANLTENCVKLIPLSNTVDSNFVYYYLKSDEGQDKIDQRVVGSTQPKLPIYNIQTLDIPFPPLPEQKAIASVLSSLDDKIDLLHRQNKTFEAMAETLFRQWFIEEEKEDWEKVTLGEVVNITSSKRIFYSEYVDEGIPFYRSKEIIELNKSGQTRSDLFISNERFDEIEAKFGAPVEGDILLTSVGTLGVTYQVKANDRFYFKDGNLTWFKDFKRISSNIIFCWLNSKDGKEQLDNISIGSTQAALTIQGLKSLELNLPSPDVIQKLDEQLVGIYQKVQANQSQIQTLENLRDTLLPKLMSGEVRVQYQTEQVA